MDYVQKYIELWNDISVNKSGRYFILNLITKINKISFNLI
jgi:hypothetical protein